ncbi:MAG: NADase-type glycan-binding domain-containing protein [Polyangiales bacterium]
MYATHAPFFALLFALLMMIWGWKAFRIVVALCCGMGSGAIAGALFGFAGLVGARDGNALAGALGGGLIAAFVGFVVGTVLGYALQKVAAGLAAGVCVGAVTYVIVVFGFSAPPQMGQTVGGLMAIGALVATLLVYDYMAAVWCGALVASTFNTFTTDWSGASEALDINGARGIPGIENITKAIEAAVREWANHLWIHLAVSLGFMLFAVVLRRFAWERRGTSTDTMALGLRSSWQEALLLSSVMLLVGELAASALDADVLAGTLPAAWPLLALATHAVTVRLERERMSAWRTVDLYIVGLGLAIVAVPLTSAIANLALLDASRIAVAPEEHLASMKTLRWYYAGFVFPGAFLPTASKASEEVRGLGVKWLITFALFPALLVWRAREMSKAAASWLPAAARNALGLQVGATAATAAPLDGGESAAATAPAAEHAAVVEASIPTPPPQLTAPVVVDRRGPLIVAVAATLILAAGIGVVATRTTTSTKEPAVVVSVSSTPQSSSAKSSASPTATGEAPSQPDGLAPVRAGGVVAELAAEDINFDDKRGGWGWGDRCFLHIKAGRFANAKAACDRGVALGPTNDVLGALYYNLGLIGQKTGDPDTARSQFRKSLEVRPGNATVVAALAALGTPPGDMAAPTLVQLRPSRSTASSYLHDATQSHPASDAFDGKLYTAWNESAAGPGKGEWIEASFSHPQHVRKIHLYTGFEHNDKQFGDLWNMNAHLKTVRVVFDGGTSVTRDIGATEHEITIEGLDVVATTVRFVADDVWPGTKWEDLCISEIDILGDGDASDRPAIVDGHIVWSAFSDERVKKELARGRPVFVAFSADWCASCATDERNYLDTAVVRAALETSHVFVVKADMTNDNKSAQTYLDRLKRVGIPDYVIFLPDGTFDLLPTQITAPMVAARIDAASRKFPVGRFASPVSGALK